MDNESEELNVWNSVRKFDNHEQKGNCVCLIPSIKVHLMKDGVGTVNEQNSTK